MRKTKFVIFILILMGAALITFLSQLTVKKIYPLKYTKYIKQYSGEYKLDPYLVAALIQVESNYKIDARSHRNANGLMQITDETGAWIASKMNIENYSDSMLYDAETNIKMGCWYLNNLRTEFGDNIDIVLAAYNAGRGNVKSWLQSHNYSVDGKKLDYIPFKETDKYVKRIETNYNIYKFVYKDKLK